MRLKCLAQGHYCRCQRNRIVDLKTESVVLSTSHNISFLIYVFIEENVTTYIQEQTIHAS